MFIYRKVNHELLMLRLRKAQRKYKYDENKFFINIDLNLPAEEILQAVNDFIDKHTSFLELKVASQQNQMDTTLKDKADSLLEIKRQLRNYLLVNICALRIARAKPGQAILDLTEPPLDVKHSFNQATSLEILLDKMVVPDPSLIMQAIMKGADRIHVDDFTHKLRDFRKPYHGSKISRRIDVGLDVLKLLIIYDLAYFKVIPYPETCRRIMRNASLSDNDALHEFIAEIILPKFLFLTANQFELSYQIISQGNKKLTKGNIDSHLGKQIAGTLGIDIAAEIRKVCPTLTDEQVKPIQDKIIAKAKHLKKAIGSEGIYNLLNKYRPVTEEKRIKPQ